MLLAPNEAVAADRFYLFFCRRAEQQVRLGDAMHYANSFETIEQAFRSLVGHGKEMCMFQVIWLIRWIWLGRRGSAWLLLPLSASAFFFSVCCHQISLIRHDSFGTRSAHSIFHWGICLESIFCRAYLEDVSMSCLQCLCVAMSKRLLLDIPEWKQ